MRYSVLEGNEQLFASKYKLVLPSEEELRAELDRERAALEDRLLDQAFDKHGWIVHRLREDYRWQLPAKVRCR